MQPVSECKKTAAIILKGCGIHYSKLSAKTVSFQDLARDGCVFVKVHDIRVGPSGGAWYVAQAIALEHGFRIVE